MCCNFRHLGRRGAGPLFWDRTGSGFLLPTLGLFDNVVTADYSFTSTSRATGLLTANLGTPP